MKKDPIYVWHVILLPYCQSESVQSPPGVIKWYRASSCQDINTIIEIECFLFSLASNPVFATTSNWSIKYLCERYKIWKSTIEEKGCHNKETNGCNDWMIEECGVSLIIKIIKIYFVDKRVLFHNDNKWGFVSRKFRTKKLITKCEMHKIRKWHSWKVHSWRNYNFQVFH